MGLCKYPVFDKTMGGIRPCGRCLPCCQNRRAKKTGRMILESTFHEHKLFVTLTYDNISLPLDVYNWQTGEVSYSCSTGVLDYRHIQKFLKRLRKRLPSASLRYFVAGEYGDKDFRPHWHMVLFGLSFKDRHIIYDCWTDPLTDRPLCDPRRLDIQIPKSDHDVSQYICAYVMKRLTRTVTPEGAPDELFRSSKGIGLGAVEDFVSALTKSSASHYISNHIDIPRQFSINGKKYPVDRYMREKILEKLDEKIPGFSAAAKDRALTHFKAEMQTLYESSDPDAGLKKLLGFDTSDSSDRNRSRHIERKYIADTAQHILTIETRAGINGK